MSPFDKPEGEQPGEPALIAIRAGAGAGKTTRITERYINHVVHDGLSPLEIVAVTFTDAAALELRSRIREKLAEKLRPDDDKLAELEAARISTFHSLAAAICRQHPVEAEVPADFALLDEVQGPLWLADNLDDALDGLPERLFRRVPFSRMRSVIRILMSDPIAAADALGVRYRHWRDAVDALRKQTMDDLLTTEAWVGAKTLLPNIYGATGDLLEMHRIAIIEGIASIEAGGDVAAAFKSIAGAKINVGKQASWSAPLIDVKESIRQIRELAKEALSDGLATMTVGAVDAEMLRRVRNVKRAYEVAQARLRQAKRDARLLDYSDLEVHAIKALDNSSVCRYYHARWKAFVVDEYQDTNPVQAEMLRRLSTPGTRRAIVGDANQSIYGFRRADPTLIDSAASLIVEAGGAIESLDTNYRTHRTLVGDMNALFGTLLVEGTFLPQTSTRDAPSSDDAWLKVFQVTKSDGSSRSDHVRVEAINMARVLKDMYGMAPVYDKVHRAHRPMQYGDVAIIANAWSSLDPFAEALASLGIPYVHMGGGNLMNMREARDGYVLLRFLADISDDLALAALLKSPFFTVNDRELLHLRQTGASTLWQALEDSAAGNGEMARRNNILGNLVSERESASPSRLLNMADSACGLSAVLMSLPSGDRRLADWRGFCELVRDIEKTSFDTFSVARILRRLDIARNDRYARVDIPRPALEAGNAVSLMTIHHAKGLEWPVVVMADLARQPRRDDSSVLFDPNLGVAIKAENVEPHEQPMLYRYMRHEVGVREKQEVKRLLYVAATRARDYLFMTASLPSAASRYAVLEPGLAAAGKECEFWPFDPADAQPPAPRRASPAPKEPQDCTGPITALPKHIPATSLAAYQRCPKQFEYQVVKGHPGIGDGDSTPGRIGTLVHTAIQHNIETAHSLQRFDRSLDKQHVGRALELAKSYRNDESLTRYRIENARYEVPITFVTEGTTITGRIDMLGPDFILDFKTGRRASEADYLMQLWIYAEAAGRDEMVLCYFDGKPPTVRHKSDMPLMRERVSEILAGVRTGRFGATPAPDRCSLCRYRSICPEAVQSPSPADIASG